jgi:hypothetical protein
MSGDDSGGETRLELLNLRQTIAISLSPNAAKDCTTFRCGPDLTAAAKSKQMEWLVDDIKTGAGGIDMLLASVERGQAAGSWWSPPTDRHADPRR